MPNIYYEQEYDSTEKSKVYFNIYFNQQSKTKTNLERKRFFTLFVCLNKLSHDEMVNDLRPSNTNNQFRKSNRIKITR